MALFTTCAILVIDQLTASASIGVQSIFWWLLTLVLFFIPYGLITAELGSTYTEEGGIYAWVRRAFGPVWAGRVAWLWWVNVALWMPSVYILFAVIFSDVFAPEMSLVMKIFMIIALTWLTVGINIVALELGRWVPNLGAVFKAIIMLALGIGGIGYALHNGAANEFSLSTLAPSWGASLAFLPVIIYNFLGFELMSGAGEEMKNPARDVPVAIARSGALIAFFYILATLGILLALPVGDISLITGLPDTFRRVFGTGVTGNALVVALSLMALYASVANMATWTMGANRSAAEAANRGDLPSVFAKLHSTYRTPASSAILCGVISTIVLIVYGLLARDAEDLFWTIFAFSSVVFLLPYLLLFPSFLKLRRTDLNTPRPYRVPGGYPVAVFLSVVCTVFILQAIVFFIYKPGAFDANYVVSVVGGVVLTIAVGELLVRAARSRHVGVANV
jgi:amino acid transporter